MRLLSSISLALPRGSACSRVLSFQGKWLEESEKEQNGHLEMEPDCKPGLHVSLTISFPAFSLQAALGDMVFP